MLRFPPRRIFVAVDFSRAASFAWDAARFLSKRFDATLEAVICLKLADVESDGSPEGSRRREYRRRIVERLRARVGPGVRIRVVTTAAGPAAALRRLARDRACDLLVLGSHRRKGLERLIRGSVAESLVHEAPCPVLIVPRAWRAPRDLLAPVHEAGYSRRGFLAAGVVARAFRARLTLLHVVADPESCPYPEALLRQCVSRMPDALVAAVRLETKILYGEPIREILRAGRGRDLIVLTAHHKSLIGDLVLGTTVERVLRRSRVPVLAIPSGGSYGAGHR